MREPDAVDGARVLGLALLVWVGASFLVGAGLPRTVLLFALPAAFLAVPLAYARVVGLRPLAASGFRAPGFRATALVLAASLGSLWLLKVLVDVQMDVFEMIGYRKEAEEETRALEEMVRGVVDKDFFLAMGAFVVAAPVCEETLFRGIMFRGFAARFGPVLAIILTTVPFAVLHGSLVRVGLMVVVGAYFGLIVWLTGNLWAGILAHAVNNFTVVMLTTRFGDDLKEFQAPWWLVVLSALVFTMAIALLELDRRERTERMSDA